jgi:carbonic anhydrase
VTRRGKLAVVAALFKEGKSNPVQKQIFPIMPARVNAPVPLSDGLNAADLLSANRGYYAFVQVLKQPAELSHAQLAAFRKLYPMNARPVQPLHARSVRSSR